MALTQTQFQTALDLFEVDESICGDLIADSTIYIAPLVPCETVPTLGVLTVDTTALAAGDATVNLALTGIDSIVLERGFVLNLDPANPIEVTTTTTVTSAAAVAVPIDDTHTATAAVGTACGYVNRAVGSTISSTSLSLNINTEGTGKTNQGRRMSSVVTEIAPEIAGDLYLNVEDRSLWDSGFIFDAAITGGEVAVLRVSAAGQLAIMGRALVTTFDDNSEAQTAVKVNYALKFQEDWRAVKPFQFLTMAQQTAYNEILGTWGIASVS